MPFWLGGGFAGEAAVARARWSKANHWPDWNAWIRAYHSGLGSVLAPGCLCKSILGSKSQSFHARTVCCSVSAALMASSAVASACRIRPRKRGGGDWKPKNFCFSTVSRSTWSRLYKACLWTMSKWYCWCWRCWNWSRGSGGGPVGWVAAGSLRPCVAWLVVGPSGWTAVWRWEFAGQLAVVECGWVGLALGLALVAAICLQGGPLVPPGGLPGRCGVKLPALLPVYTPWVRSSGLMPTAGECALLVASVLLPWREWPGWTPRWWTSFLQCGW